MQQWLYRKIIWGGLVTLGLVTSLTCAYAGTTSPASPSSASAKLERLRIAIAPLGWDTNYTWGYRAAAANSISGPLWRTWSALTVIPVPTFLN